MNKINIIIFLLLGINIIQADCESITEQTHTYVLDQPASIITPQFKDILLKDDITNATVHSHMIVVTCFSYQITEKGNKGHCINLDNMYMGMLAFIEATDKKEARYDSLYRMPNGFGGTSLLNTYLRALRKSPAWSVRLDINRGLAFSYDCVVNVKIKFKAKAIESGKDEVYLPHLDRFEPSIVKTNTKTKLVAYIRFLDDEPISFMKGYIESSDVRFVKETVDYSNADIAKNLDHRMNCTMPEYTVMKCTMNATQLVAGTYDVILKYYSETYYRLTGKIAVLASNPSYYEYKDGKVVITGHQLSEHDAVKVVPININCNETNLPIAKGLVSGTSELTSRVTISWTTADPTSKKVCYQIRSEGEFFEVKLKTYYSTKLINVIDEYVLEDLPERKDITDDINIITVQNIGAIVGGIVGGAVVIGAGFGVYKFYVKNKQ